MADRKKVRVVELFAGVGGFRLGLERCAPEVYETVWADQWEPGQARQWAWRCYTSHFGSCCNEDIATVLDQVPEHDLLVGGFPCQDYSVARTGARGIEGKKGVLWWSIDAVIRKRRPRFVLLENVDRLLKSPAHQRGRDFGIILKCLDQAGYGAEWRVINAADYGEVQRRRRTFLFAYRLDAAPFGERSLLTAGGPRWLREEGFFAGAFPVEREAADPRPTELDLGQWEDLVAVSEGFQAPFRSGGALCRGRVWSEELVPVPPAKRLLLGDVVDRGGVDERYFLKAEELEKWKVMKGAKRIDRVSRTGFPYRFSEGAISFPDPLDRPARTMLTSEGTKNRSSHVVSDPRTGRLRRLTPEECEQINGFDPGWTDTGMPERQRYFIMGNALVVPLVERMAARLLELL